MKHSPSRMRSNAGKDRTLPRVPGSAPVYSGTGTTVGDGVPLGASAQGQIRTSISNNNMRPLPNPIEEAQMIRQRSQANMNHVPGQGYPPGSASFAMPVPSTPAMGIQMRASSDGVHPYSMGYGSHPAIMAQQSQPLLPAAPPAFPHYSPQVQSPPTLHFGPAPALQARRYKTTKKVTLTQGNLVLDCPVPTKLLDVLPRKIGDEFTTMRYTAVTSDPNDFPNQNYTLRPKMFQRETELFIVMTMYNVRKC
ncbi:hypothetical protein BGW38_002488 [Lunasporangiospora selenospora]|uniref:Chitin synthase N-terminal domain-containing protein n=1 Tax=Lunasporangiospora selenospora TaxID=979761 RepID=A0A9P6KDC5_9FUNG|nr:hypothetical protein BGW38_002488 [Lunasporangiospora selenospora]